MELAPWLREHLRELEERLLQPDVRRSQAVYELRGRMANCSFAKVRAVRTKVSGDPNGGAKAPPSGRPC
jgi:hypothetical protein